MRYLLSFIFICCSITTFCQSKSNKRTTVVDKKKNCTDQCCNAPKERTMACKLTSPELQQRKATTIASLKRKLIEKKAVPDGYTYRFKGTDELLDELTTFIKTERMCCDFFDFALKVSGDASETWLTISGPKGAKEFIDTELEL